MRGGWDGAVLLSERWWVVLRWCVVVCGDWLAQDCDAMDWANAAVVSRMCGVTARFDACADVPQALCWW